MAIDHIGHVKFMKQRVYPLVPGTSVDDPSNPTAIVPPGEYPLYRDSEREEYWFAMTGFQNVRGSVENVPNSDLSIVQTGDTPDTDKKLDVESKRFQVDEMREMLLEEISHYDDPPIERVVTDGAVQFMRTITLYGGSVVFVIEAEAYMRILSAMTMAEREMDPSDLLEKRIGDKLESLGEHRFSRSQWDAVFDSLEDLNWREPPRSVGARKIVAVYYSDGTGDAGTSIVELEVPRSEVSAAWFGGEWTIAPYVAEEAPQTPWWRRALDSGVFRINTTDNDGDNE